MAILRNMTTKTNPRKGINETAFSVVQIATGEADKPVPTKAQETGRQGGLKGGNARAKKMTAEERSEIAKKAAASRWKKKD
jgi:hypothetical protein